MNSILRELMAVRDEIGLCWVGNAGWLRPSPVPTVDLAPVLDVAFVTHGHGDHFGENSRGTRCCCKITSKT